MKRTEWVYRKFNFNIPAGWVYNILCRLEGVSVRLEHLTHELSDKSLEHKLNNSWSIKEHIGHLSDLEGLHSGRIKDFLDRKQVLRAADMSNKETNSANHNEKSIRILLDEFNLKRKLFLKTFTSLDDKTQHFSSLHPRLKVMMKPVDMAFFTAEHDDHHLASIYEIVDFLKTSKK